MYRYINRHFIDRVLRHLETREEKPYLELSVWDQRIDWPSLAGGYEVLPAHNHGQTRDTRLSLPDGSSLHIHYFPQRGRVRFHRDRRDPIRDPLGHLFEDTRTPTGMLIGALAGMLLPPGVGSALLGAATGALVANWMDTGPEHVWEIAELRPTGGWTAWRVPVRSG
jgi:hypothetical protein